MKHSKGTFRASGGIDLFFQSWQPEEQPIASVAIVHGWGEHSERYSNVVEYLISHGYAVYGFDQRGHGRSPGKRGHINHWEEYRQDLRSFLHIIGEQHPDGAVFLWGHSLGALIALDYILCYSEELRGAVIGSSPIEPVGVAKPYLVLLSRLLSKVWPSFSLDRRLDATLLSRDQEVVQQSKSDPMMHGLCSARWATEVLNTISRVKAQVTEVSIPVLFLHGEADRVNLASGTSYLFDSVGIEDKTVRIYPSMYHELHNDIDHEQVLVDVRNWLGEHL
jgi:alpha-beta hydrolase superfamily lysophospholipase